MNNVTKIKDDLSHHGIHYRFNLLKMARFELFCRESRNVLPTCCLFCKDTKDDLFPKAVNSDVFIVFSPSHGPHSKSLPLPCLSIVRFSTNKVQDQSIQVMENTLLLANPRWPFARLSIFCTFGTQRSHASLLVHTKGISNELLKQQPYHWKIMENQPFHYVAKGLKKREKDISLTAKKD